MFVFSYALAHVCAGNNFSLFTGNMFLLVGHFTNWIGYCLLTDKTLKKITRDVLVRCSIIMSNHNVKLVGHFQNLVIQHSLTDCFFQHCMLSFSWETGHDKKTILVQNHHLPLHFDKPGLLSNCQKGATT